VRAVSIFVAVSFFIAWPTAASAQNKVPGASGSSGGSSASVAVLQGKHGEILARTAIHRRGSDETAVHWTCHYYGVAGGDGVARPERTPDVVDVLEKGSFYWLVCTDDATGAETETDLFQYDPANPFGPLGATDRASAQARAQLVAPNPSVATAPPVDKPQIVGLASWFWITDPWTPLHATATIAGLSATVTATPDHVTWDPGDGSGLITCYGPGTPYHDQDGPSPDCGHTYLDRSTVADPNGTFALKVTVTYTVAWTSTDGDGGTLDPINATTTVPLVVHEIQAMINS
jgi:hypothetical protein